jgi:poly(hydroxyalkanoate) granule-associated protein
MATAKKSTSNSSSSGPQGFQSQAEHLSKRLGKSAQQVWLAGLGVLGRAQNESSRVFDSLVKEGASVESKGRKRAKAGFEAASGRFSNRYAQARQKVSSRWEQLENTVDQGVKNVLHSLHIPDRDEVQALREQVDTLKAQVRANKAKARRHTATKRPPTANSETTTSAAANEPAIDPDPPVDPQAVCLPPLTASDWRVFYIPPYLPLHSWHNGGTDHQH